MSRIIIEKLDNADSLESLRDEWQTLFTKSESSPFLSWEWLSTWYKQFGADKTLFVLKARRGGQLIGLLPLCLHEKRILGIKIKQLGFVGGEVGGADYLDLIAEPENKSEVTEAFFDYLSEEKCFDLIKLENLSTDSPTTGFLEAKNKSNLSQSLRFQNLISSVCPKIDLKTGWAAVLQQSKRASNFKRKLKQLEKMPGFEFRSVTAPNELTEAFERFFALHEKRWANRGGSELSGHPQLISFQRDLVTALANTKLLRFDEVWAEGECRSSVYGLDDGRTFYYYNSGYDLEWSKHSVGLVLIGLSVKNAVERGNSLYDFLRGDETYKYDWANGKTALTTVTLMRRTFPAFVYELVNRASYNLKNFSKSALPHSLTEPLKIRRREWKRDYQFSDLKAEKTSN